MAKAPKSFEKLAFVSSEREEAKAARKALIAKYGNHDAAHADAIIALGGDGFMLRTLRRNMTLVRRGLPVYGMNKGTIGFLMNHYQEENLLERLASAKRATMRPLCMIANGAGGTFHELAINEVALFRQTRQAAHIKIYADDKIRLERLISDGILVATPAGSTAYNLSAHGPVLPMGSDILALTPISAFRPRRWGGALLHSNTRIVFEVLDPEKRPVSATADSQEIRHVTRVEIFQDPKTTLNLLFDSEHGLDEKVLQEQFLDYGANFD